MGTLTNQQLQEELLANLGNRTDFSVGLNSRLQTALTFSQDRIARRHKFRELRKLSTTSTIFNNNPDDKFLNTPPNLRTVYSIRLIDGLHSRKLDWISPITWDTVLPDPSDDPRRRPERYTYFRNVFEFHPLPDKVYTMELRWEGWPEAFTALSNTSSFEHKDDIILYGATAYLYDSLDQSEKARKFAVVFQQMLENAVLLDDKHPHEEIKPLFELDSPVGEYWTDPFIRELGV